MVFSRWSRVWWWRTKNAVIAEESITIVSGVVVGSVSAVGIIGNVSGVDCTVVIGLCCLGCCCVAVQRLVGGRVRLVVGVAAVGVIWGSVCSGFAAFVVVLFVCCCGIVAAEQCTGCINVDDRVGSVLDVPRASVIACTRACCSGVGGSWKGCGWEVHAGGSGSNARNHWSG